jgi:hypothetical protein
VDRVASPQHLGRLAGESVPASEDDGGAHFVYLDAILDAVADAAGTRSRENSGLGELRHVSAGLREKVEEAVKEV